MKTLFVIFTFIGLLNACTPEATDASKSQRSMSSSIDTPSTAPVKIAPSSSVSGDKKYKPLEDDVSEEKTAESKTETVKIVSKPQNKGIPTDPTEAIGDKGANEGGGTSADKGNNDGADTQDNNEGAGTNDDKGNNDGVDTQDDNEGAGADDDKDNNEDNTDDTNTTKTEKVTLSGKVTGTRSVVIVALGDQSINVLPEGEFSFSVEQGTQAQLRLTHQDSTQQCPSMLPAFTAQSARNDLLFQCFKLTTIGDLVSTHASPFMNCVSQQYGNNLLAEDVKVIDCSNKQLDSLSGIEHFPNVKTVNVSNNQLASIDIDKLSRLEMIDLSNNQLTSIAIAQGSQLRTLDLSNNQLTFINLSSAAFLNTLNVQGNTGLVKPDVSGWAANLLIQWPQHLQSTLRVHPIKVRIVKGQKISFKGVLKTPNKSPTIVIGDGLHLSVKDAQIASSSRGELVALKPGETSITVSIVIDKSRVEKEIPLEVLGNQPAIGWDKDGKQDDERYQQVVEMADSGLTVAVVTASGTVKVWGEWYNTSLEDISAIQGQLVNVESIAATSEAFAALKSDGSVVTWGDASSGGDASSVQHQLKNVTQVVGTAEAFAALTEDGNVVLWGNPLYGSDGLLYKSDRTTQSMKSQLTNIASLHSTSYGFSAITKERKVITWGGWGEGSVTHQQLEGLNNLTDVVEIFTSLQAYAALMADGSVYTWGNVDYGGNSQSAQSQLTDIVDIKPGGHAFAAIKSDGGVIAWGDALRGGDLSSVKNELHGVVDVIPSYQSMAALKNDGTVVTWGRPGYGGDSGAIKHLLVDVESVASNYFSYCAVKKDGSLVSWGMSWYAGDLNKIPVEAKGISHVRGVLGGFIGVFEQ